MGVLVPSINPFGFQVTMAPIDGFDGYFISNRGDVWSARQSGKWLKPHLTKHGYQTVGLRKNNIRIRTLIHRLVALAFIPNPNNLPQVNHKDECKTNNTTDNLEWCSADYNSNYGTRNSRISKPVVNLDTGERFESTLEVQRKLGICCSSITEVCKGNKKRHTAGGYHWAYESEAS